MREQLIAYLMDDLSAEERAQVKIQIEQDPNWEQEFKQLKSCFEASTSQSHEDEHPHDLTSRTCCLIQNATNTKEKTYPPFVASLSRKSIQSSFTPEHKYSGTAYRWSLVDLAVTGGVLATLGMLLLPALHQSREASRGLTCQNNLQQIGRYLVEYAKGNGNYLPTVAPHENAGIYTVKLTENGFVRRMILEKILRCPGSPNAEKFFAQTSKAFVPTPQQLALAHQLAKARPQKLMVILQQMSSSYAYRIGYYDIRGLYRDIELTERHDSPMLADAPNWQADGTFQAVHVGDRSQGGWYQLAQDLSVKFVLRCKADQLTDNYFLNSNHQQAAGQGPDDVVLGLSEVRPDGFSVTLGSK